MHYLVQDDAQENAQAISKRMRKMMFGFVQNQGFKTSVEISEFFDMWNRLVISYLRAKFYCDTTIVTCKTCIFHVCFWQFSTSQQSFSIMTSLSMTLSHIKVESRSFYPKPIISFVPRAVPEGAASLMTSSK